MYNDFINILSKEIKTPLNLSDWMHKHIKYGYVDQQNNVYRIKYEDRINIPTYGFDFFRKFKLLTPQEVYDYKLGVCWDQAEFIRYFFQYMFNFPFGVLFYIDNTPPNYLTHSIIIYKEKNGIYWFENVLQNDTGSYKGIHKINNIYDIFKKDIKKNFNNIKYGWITKPPFHINGIKYLKFCINHFNKKNKDGISNELYE
jgi:hypothetical protein